MHTDNLHLNGYDFNNLTQVLPEIKNFLIQSPGGLSIDFSNPEAVYTLNKALLLADYKLTWSLPKGYLCPGVPSRADYIHHLSDMFASNQDLTGVDIGTGANAIYPLLAAQIKNWRMIATDINPVAVTHATHNIKSNPGIASKIQVIHQSNNAYIFKGILKKGTYVNFTMCNPPFFESAQNAAKASRIKNKNLKINNSDRNFAGQHQELWCNGGEALFLKRMIKESALFKEEVGWFTSLVSRKQNLPKLYKQLDKLGASYKTVPMSQGHKKTRFLAWCYE